MNYVNQSIAHRIIVLPILSILVLIGLSGCAKYQVQRLRPLGKNKQAAQQNISFSYRMFTITDCRKYLGKNAIKKGYQPIQITFVNNSDHYFMISKRSLSFPCISTKEVAKKLHFNTAARATGYGVLGLFLWPFIVPAIVDGIGSAKANKKMDADFSAKALSKQVVEPHTTVSGIVFVDANIDFDEKFTFTVSDIAHTQYVLSTLTPEVVI